MEDGKYTHWLVLSFNGVEHYTCTNNDSKMLSNTQISEIVNKEKPSFRGNVWIKSIATSLNK